MRNLLARIYSIYGMLVFGLTTVIFMTPQLILAQNKNWHSAALRLNHVWARMFFFLAFIKVKIKLDGNIDRSQQYVICANHFSYLDIPAMGLIPVTFKFIGKDSITNVPLFGYMFRKIHIPVNRNKLRSRAISMKQAILEISEGFNMLFFAEGGIRSTEPPEMVPFMDGAFRVSVQSNLPVLPVVLHDNYRILPDDGKFLFFPQRLRITILEPIYPQNNEDAEISRLKGTTYSLIQSELNKN